MKAAYDYLIVGSGLFGAVFANRMKDAGKRCLIVEKRRHTGGNVFCEKIEGIDVHRYGAHIFHTNDEKIWSYVNKFSAFNNYVNSPLANYQGRLYNLPFNMNTFNMLWGVTTPAEAISRIEMEKKNFNIIHARNLEEQAISMVGFDLYEKFIKHYTEKQWGRKANELPASIIKRIPLRFTYDNNYFNDRFQGIPVDGYNSLINKLIDGIEVKINFDYFKNRESVKNVAKKTVFTGKIDEYFEYKFGCLEYRSLSFQDQILDIDNYQGNAVINFTDATTDHTRIYEHKHFTFGKQPGTVITKEFPLAYSKGAEAFYPICDEKNKITYAKYKELARLDQATIFGGRLAEYKYYDMHQVIGSALRQADLEVTLGNTKM